MVDEPTIQFPCVYPVKVIGEQREGFLDDVLKVVSRHDGDCDPHSVRQRDSRKGNYNAITLTINATGEAHLKALFADLKQCAGVRMVL